MKEYFSKEYAQVILISYPYQAAIPATSSNKNCFMADTNNNNNKKLTTAINAKIVMLHY